MSRENTNNKTENVLEISNLCVEYRTRDSVVKAVNGLNLTLKKGQALGVVGRPEPERPPRAWRCWA